MPFTALLYAVLGAAWITFPALVIRYQAQGGREPAAGGQERAAERQPDLPAAA